MIITLTCLKSSPLLHDPRTVSRNISTGRGHRTSSAASSCLNFVALLRLSSNMKTKQVVLLTLVVMNGAAMGFLQYLLCCAQNCTIGTCCWWAVAHAMCFTLFMWESKAIHSIVPSLKEFCHEQHWASQSLPGIAHSYFGFCFH